MSYYAWNWPNSCLVCGCGAVGFKAYFSVQLSSSWKTTVEIFHDEWSSRRNRSMFSMSENLYRFSVIKVTIKLKKSSWWATIVTFFIIVLSLYLGKVSRKKYVELAIRDPDPPDQLPEWKKNKVQVISDIMGYPHPSNEKKYYWNLPLLSLSCLYFGQKVRNCYRRFSVFSMSGWERLAV